MSNALNLRQHTKKWEGVLNYPAFAKIEDPFKRDIVALMLENTEIGAREAMDTEGLRASQSIKSAGALNEADPVSPNVMGTSSSTAGAGGIDMFDPVMISMVRRNAPNLISYDIMGVQPMTGPSGLVFALRSRYANQAGAENFYNEVDTTFTNPYLTDANTLGQKHVGSDPSGNSSVIADLAANGLYNFGSAMLTQKAELLGTADGEPFPQMSFSIEKITVSAKSRALAAMYTPELAQDLRAVHGLDADSELTNILSAELLAEINREAVRTVFLSAVKGSLQDTTTPGVFDLDVDANGRWSVEKFKGLHFQIERECNQIAKDTRRGKGNILICSSDVASALQMTGVLSYTPNLATSLHVDDTGNTFAGLLGGRIKVYIDPYATGNFMVVGYKGQSRFDAGIFYCPYVPLQLARAVYPNSFQPTIGFKTRYGMVANPFAEGLTKGNGVIHVDSNVYYRRTKIKSLM